jgi:PKD repeat protein
MTSAPCRAPERFRVLGLSTGLSLLLVAGALATPAAAEATVERDGPVATAIRGLEIGDATYDVEFVTRSAATLYGNPPGFDFDTEESAHEATRAVNDVLTAEAGITGVGRGAEAYFVGFGITSDPVDGAIQVRVWVGATSPDPENLGVWDVFDSSGAYDASSLGSFADFTRVESGDPGRPRANPGGPYLSFVEAPVPFDGTGSTDGDGEIQNYEWQFGDGTVGNGARPSKTYDSPGTYRVALTVTDDSGLRDTAFTTAVIGDGSIPPIADAGGPYTVPPGIRFAFDGTGSRDPDGEIAQYQWSFGDGRNGFGPTPEHTYFNEGLYFVTLTVFDHEGNFDTDTTRVYVALGNLPPKADAGPPVAGVQLEEVQFDGSASTDEDGEIVSYEWDFGDGNSGTGEAPTHTYTEIDTYTVTLTVTDDQGDIDTATTTADIQTNNVPPTANAGGPYTGLLGEAVSFDGSGSDDPDGEIVAYDWDFGDGSMGAGEMPEHEYLTNGYYEVTLTVTDDRGATNTNYSTVSVEIPDRPPIANAGGPYAGTAGQPLVLDGRNSGDPEGGAITYEWDFGDGSDPGSGVNPVHVYDEAGVYDITLTVTDPLGADARSTTRAFIGDGNIPPVAESGGRYSGVAGTPIAFDGTESRDLDGEIALFEWDFGDGNTSNEAAPSKTYDEAGLYIVALRVTDDAGASDVDVTIAHVGDASIPPTADAGGPYGGTVDKALTFDGSASTDPDGTIVSYEWDFGDGSQGSGATATHTYTETGEFLAVLTVTDDSGETSQAPAAVVVARGNLPPIADAGGPYLGVENAPVQFDGSGSFDLDGTIVSYQWTFGDGETGTGVAPTHTYTPGAYSVILLVTDDNGAVDAAETWVVVLDDDPRMSPEQGTIGTLVEVFGFGFGDDPGNVYAEVRNNKGKVQKKKLSIVTWSNNRVVAQWTTNVDPAPYPVFLQPKGGDPLACGNFEVRLPRPVEVPTDMGVPGFYTRASGFFFGSSGNSPKVDYTYVNSKGKEVRVKATVDKEASVFDPATGAGVLWFTLPDFKEKDLPAIGILAVRTKVGDAVAHPTFQVEPPPPPFVEEYAPDAATIGTRVELLGIGFGAKKGKVYAEVPNSKGKVQKKKLKIVAWAANRVVAEWTAKVAPGEYALFLEAKGFDPLEVGALEIEEPRSLDVPADVALPGADSTLDGLFMGTKKAKPKLVFTYENSKGKTVSVNVKLFKNSILFDDATGDGVIPFEVPKLKSKDLPAEGVLTFSNSIGESVVKDTLTIVETLPDL